ncbi:MAG: hypothetical protein M1816_003717 [Peltula sp. TS41687]|nr:MAG: hypothetical protein M1816_003717 [Peltula sp. TS41687]
MAYAIPRASQATIQRYAPIPLFKIPLASKDAVRDPRYGVYLTGLTYNSSSTQWACCNSGDTACSTSSNGTFSAPAPAALRQQTMTILNFIPSSTSTTISTSRRTTTSATDSTTPASSTGTVRAESSNNTSLKPAAAAGIGVGATIAVLGLITVAVLLLLRRRKRKRQGTIVDTTGGMPAKDVMSGNDRSKTPLPEYSAELQTQERAYELGYGSEGNQRPQELSG